MQSIKLNLKTPTKIMSKLTTNGQISNVITTSKKRETSDTPLPENPAKRVLVNRTLTFQDISKTMQQENQEINKIQMQVNNNIQRAARIKKSEEARKGFDKNFDENQKDTMNMHYYLENQTEVAEIINNDDFTNITFYDKNNNLEKKFNVTFYKNDPEIKLKYIDKTTNFIINKDQSQKMEINNEVLHYEYDSEAKTVFSNFYNNSENKEISLANKFVCINNTTTKNTFYHYTEKSEGKTKGLFLNDKINGDDHTGVIAFTPSTLEDQS